MGGHSSGGLFPGAAGTDGSGLGASSGVGAIAGASSLGVGGMRKRLLDEAVTDEARRIVKELYRPNAEIGDGGAADAIREQLRTGKLVGGKDHIRKGRERLRQIKRILAKNPDHPDRALLERLRNDLEDALGGA